MSGFLLDTNVPSELMLSSPDPGVQRWVLKQDNESLFLSVVSIGELLKGISILPQETASSFGDLARSRAGVALGAMDPLTYGAVAIGLLAAAVVASYVPALQASAVDPVEALRAE